MMHTGNADLDRWVREVGGMKPGEYLDVDIMDLMLIPGLHHNGAEWNGADRVLENIIGSSWTHSYQTHPNGRSVTFHRHVEDGRRHFMSPDQRGKSGEAP